MKYIYVIGKTSKRITWGQEIPINHIIWFETESAAVDYIMIKSYENAVDPLRFMQELNDGLSKEYLCKSYEGNEIVSYWWYITRLEPATAPATETKE